MKNKLYIMVLLIIFLILFTLISCSKQVFNTTTTKVAVVTTTTQTTTTIEATTTTMKIDMDKVKFWEAIVDGEKSYDITDKVLDYPSEEIEILSDVVDGKIGLDEEITKFWELATRVQKDFFLADMIIGGSLKQKNVTQTDGMTKIITLIKDWADNTEKGYVYYAKYLDTKQADYDFKVDECKDKASELHTEYLELRSPYIKEYNLYNGIE